MKIIGLMVVGSNEADRYLEKSLNEFKRLADDAVIVLNNADEKTKKMVKQTGFWSYEDNREWGLHQPAIKTDLLKKISRLNPDWVLPIDADERFEASLTRGDLEEMARGKIACYFYVTNLWNDENHYARGLSFWNIRFFKFRPDLGLDYLKKPLHCGLGPPYAYKLGSYVPHLLIHYGLMKPEDRERKVERYQKYDPRAVHKDRSYYEALTLQSSGSEFIESDVKQKVVEEVNKMKYQKKYG